jgi:hypothetical protein
MSNLFWLSEGQLRRIKPFFPLSHGVPRVDDRRVISGPTTSSPTGVTTAIAFAPRSSCGEQRPVYPASKAAPAWEERAAGLFSKAAG